MQATRPFRPVVRRGVEASSKVSAVELLSLRVKTLDEVLYESAMVFGVPNPL